MHLMLAPNKVCCVCATHYPPRERELRFFHKGAVLGDIVALDTLVTVVDAHSFERDF